MKSLQPQKWSALDTNLKLRSSDKLTRSFRSRQPKRRAIRALADQMLAESRTKKQ